MNKEAAILSPFDALAREYDAVFSHSLTGSGQRMVSREHLGGWLKGRGPLRILEINCGTGEDAIWLAGMGHVVVATDQSAGMIRTAREKSGGGERTAPTFIQCDFCDLEKTFYRQRFDLIFSNFAGLNCVRPEDLPGLGKQFDNLLNEGGHLAIVVFGKYCWWETFYYLEKGEPRKAFRRWSKKASLARLAEGVDQQVYYYSANQWARAWRSFRLWKKGPVGLFVPPSYLEGAMKRKPRLFRWLAGLEKRMLNFSMGSALADHMFLLFKKEMT